MNAAMNVDLNSDLGESYGRWVLGDDEALLDVVTSANVACGFHAGDPSTLRRTCADSAKRGVVIGAQVGYPDLAGFGRRFIDMESGELTDAVLYQLGALEAMARVAGSRVAYVKPHGALYNTIVSHEVPGRGGRDGGPRVRRDAAGPRSAGVGVPPARRRGRGAYGHRGVRRPCLHARGHARLAATARSRAARGRRGGSARRHDGDRRRGDGGGRHDDRPAADSVCVHGDSPDAVAMARAVRAELERAGVELRPFAL
jgi:UPF0271 protein